MKGPWSIVGGGRRSLMTLTDALIASRHHRYEVEYRRAEGGSAAGYYLFGPEFHTGCLLESGTADAARFEATALVARQCSLPDPVGAIVRAAEHGGAS